MARRNQLKNLACGIAGRFSSRNNDIDGYWALGLLYSAADAAGTNAVSLDIFSEAAKPPCEYTSRQLSEFEQYINELLEKHQLTGHVVAATIDIEFDVEPPPLAMLSKNTHGDPYIGRVTLTDDLGKTRSASFRGWCRKHDPKKEHRSTRFHSS